MRFANLDGRTTIDGHCALGLPEISENWDRYRASAEGAAGETLLSSAPSWGILHPRRAETFRGIRLRARPTRGASRSSGRCFHEQ